jgi:hypothetical protein
MALKSAGKRGDSRRPLRGYPFQESRIPDGVLDDEMPGRLHSVLAFVNMCLDECTRGEMIVKW